MKVATIAALARLTIAAQVITLAGCAATVAEGPRSPIQRFSQDHAKHVALRITGPHTGSADWEMFKGEWRAAFKTEAARFGAAFEAIEGRAKPEGTAGTLVTLDIRDYRYLTSGARYGFGIMTGNAYINAGASFSDIATGTPMGSASYNTTSTAWEGIFSAMTDKQVRAITEAIFRDIKGAAPSAAAAPPPVAPASARPVSAPAAPREVIGQESYQVERLAEVKACNAAARAVLTGKGPGVETYSIACSNGDFMAVRCEFGACKVLR